MNIPVKVHIELDFSLGILTHHVLVPPAIFPPTTSPSVEVPVPMKWPPGFALNQNKLTTTVKHKCQTIVQDGHDCGILIPDITYVVPNFWWVKMWLSSKREIIFAASKVKMDKVAVGCAQVWPGPLPFMTCGEPISAPTALPITSWTNTLRVNMTGGDLAAGIVKAVVSMVIDFFFSKIGKGAAATAQKAAVAAAKKALVEGGKKAMYKMVARHIAKNVLGNYLTDFNGVIKTGLNSLTGLAISTARGDPTFKFAFGAAGAKVEITLRGTRTRTGDTTPSGSSLQGEVLGWQRDTSGGGANFGQGQ